MQYVPPFSPFVLASLTKTLTQLKRPAFIWRRGKKKEVDNTIASVVHILTYANKKKKGMVAVL